MVFGLSVRERGAAAAVKAIKPWFDALYRYRGSLSSDALRAPYVFGFLTSLISLTAKVAVGNKVQGRVHGQVVLAAWPQITGDSWVGVGSRIRELAMSHDPLFNEGVNNSVKLVRLIYGKPDLHDADVAAAIEDGRKLSADLEFLSEPDENHSEYGAAAAVLWQRLFIARLSQER